jgi:hypothetical protein
MAIPGVLNGGQQLLSPATLPATGGLSGVDASGQMSIVQNPAFYAQSVSLPSAFNWPSSTYPLNITLNTPNYGLRTTGALASGSFNPLSSTAYSTCLAGLNVYVSNTGSNSNPGTQVSPVASIWNAQQLINASSAPGTIWVQAGLYNKDTNFSQSVTTNQPTQDTVYMAYGGRATVTTHDENVTWSTTGIGAYGNCYVSTAVANAPPRIIDLVHLNQYGMYPDEILVNNVSQVNGTMGSFWYDSNKWLSAASVSAGGTGYAVGDIVTLGGGTFTQAAQAKVTSVSGGVVTGLLIYFIGIGYTATPSNSVSTTGGSGSGLTITATWSTGVTWLNRGDGVAPTQNNTRLFRIASNFASTNSQYNLFWVGQNPGDGFDFQGAAQLNAVYGCCYIIYTSAAASNKIIYFNGCSFRYAGFYGNTGSNYGNGLTLNSHTGICWCDTCDASANQSDGFNHHDSYSLNGVFLTINCTGSVNGLPGSLSNNGWTSHDDCVGVDIAGDYVGMGGVTCAFINTAQSFLCGTQSRQSRGDVIFGGVFTPGEVSADNTAQVWCYNFRPYPNTAADATYKVLASGATIYLHPTCWPTTGVKMNSVGGTITTYTN